MGSAVVGHGNPCLIAGGGGSIGRDVPVIVHFAKVCLEGQEGLGVGFEQTPIAASFCEEASCGDYVVPDAGDSGVHKWLLRCVGKIDAIL